MEYVLFYILILNLLSVKAIDLYNKSRENYHAHIFNIKQGDFRLDSFHDQLCSQSMSYGYTTSCELEDRRQ